MFDDTPAPRPAHSGPERRRAARASAPAAISVREAGRHRLPALLQSLSPFGCSVANVTLRAGEGTVWVRLPGVESQAARCVWRGTGTAGLEFEHPLHPAVARRFHAPEALLRTKPDRQPRHECDTALMRAVHRDMARVVDQRIEQRFVPPSRASLGFRLAGQPASLRDMSASGLKVAADIGAAIGTEVAVAFAGHPEMSGRIVWMRQGTAGIRLPEGALELFEAA
jgi:hypothetical protein